VPGGDVSLLATRPAALTVPVGSTLTFRTDSTTERHNVAAGPAEFIERYLAEQLVFPITPLDRNRYPGDLVYGTERADVHGPTGPFPYDGANHGNGFISLAATDASPRTAALGREQRITFTAAGRYTLYCLLHYPAMRTDVSVVP
jgi:plastocyanin